MSDQPSRLARMTAPAAARPKSPPARPAPTPASPASAPPPVQPVTPPVQARPPLPRPAPATAPAPPAMPGPAPARPASRPAIVEAPRGRVLLFAPPPAPIGELTKVLESEGFSVLMAEEPAAVEPLLRSATVERIFAVAPVLSPELLASFRALAPRAEVSVAPGLSSLLEERIAAPAALLDFAVRSLLALSALTPAEGGPPAAAPGPIHDLAEKAARALGLSAHDVAATRLTAALLGVVRLLGRCPAAEHLATTALSAGAPAADPEHEALAGFAEAMGCPFSLLAPASGPRSARAPLPREVVTAARRYLEIAAAGSANPALDLRRLALGADGAEPELHPAAVEAVLASARGSDRAARRGRILLVDPDAGARNLLALRLANEGYEAVGVADGRAALEELRRTRPAAVLSEVVLPGLDGFALLDAFLREHGRAVPFLFLSSRADALSINKGLLLGAADYLPKDTHFEILLTKLGRALAERVDAAEAAARLTLSEVSVAGRGEPAVVPYSELGPGLHLLDRFLIERDLGEGGMGKVFLARDERLEERLVLKVLKPGASEDAIARFKREIRLARRITHPNVVRIFDFWEAGPISFVTMEYLEGSDLYQILRERGPFPLPAVLRIAGELFPALQAAHAVGILHRDIKPHNVLMLPAGHIKVLDFGIAQGLDAGPGDNLTQAGMVLGTPRYMSPEQLLGQKLDPRSDLFSAGVLLFELLTGRDPYEGGPEGARGAGDVSESMRRRIVGEAPDLAARLPAALVPLLTRLLRRNRDERFPSAEAAAEEVARLRAELAAPALAGAAG